SCRGVRGAGRTRDKADAGLPGEFAVCLGHHGGSTFLAAHSYLDVGIMQGIEYGEIAFSGHAESVLDAVPKQLCNENLAACARRGSIRCCHVSVPLSS